MYTMSVRLNLLRNMLPEISLNADKIGIFFNGVERSLPELLKGFVFVIDLLDGEDIRDIIDNFQILCCGLRVFGLYLPQLYGGDTAKEIHIGCLLFLSAT